MDRDEPLFSTYHFYSAVRNAPVELAKAIDELTDAQLFEGDPGALLNRLVADHLINVPVLDLDGIQPSQREVDVDVSDDPRRLAFDRDEPVYIKATEIAFRVPYKGDADVFQCRPSTYSFNPPYADVGSDSIVIRVVREDQNPAEYRKVFDRTLEQIQKLLNQLRSDCAGLEETLKATATGQLAKRREKRQEDQSLIEGLGFGKAAS